MVVCVCNNVTESKVRDAIEAGASDVKSVLRHLNVKVQCAVCVDTVSKMLRPQSIDGDAAAL